MDCLFCKIANKELSSEVVYEDDYALAFKDTRPLTAGHTVVIPKKHAENILDLPDEEVGPLFMAVKNTVKKIGGNAFTIGINHGKVSGQAVDHLHVHVIPRFTGDGGGSLHSIFKHDRD